MKRMEGHERPRRTSLLGPMVLGAPLSVSLVLHLTQLDSIEPWCISIHLASSKTCTEHDGKQNAGQYIVFLY